MSDSNNNLVAQNPQTALTGYDEPQIQQFADIVKRIAPWANNTDSPMTNQEIGLVVRRALTMGIDPLNPHEVQIWKDKGRISFQIGYPLTAQWVRHFHGEHTEPRFTRLTEEELENEGLQPLDVAYYARFIMKSDLVAMREFMSMGVFDNQEVRAMFEIVGMGVANIQEYRGQYFAPKGRSRSWKVKKRALTDAYRCKFGTPTKSEISQLRRDLPAMPELDDLAYAAETAPRASVAGIRAIADNRAARRDNPIVDKPELAGAAALLYDAVEGDFSDSEPEPEIEDTSLSSAAEPPSGNSTRPYSPTVLREKIQQGIAQKRAVEFSYGSKSANFHRAVRSNLKSCFAGDPHSGLNCQLSAEYLTGEVSAHNWDDATVATLHNLLNASQDDGGLWIVDPLAVIEIVAVARVAAVEAGQTEVELG
jgi:hypothetical protein